MALRSIPPKTSTGPGRRASRPIRRPIHPKRTRYSFREIEKTGLYKPRLHKKPREWKYVTKPFFARIKEPLIDVFKEAQEIQILIDLGGFTREEVSFGLKDGKYTIYAKHADQEFKEEIDLPKGVDMNNVVESFKNNILSLILPKKHKQTAEKKEIKERQRL